MTDSRITNRHSDRSWMADDVITDDSQPAENSWDGIPGSQFDPWNQDN